MGDMITDGLLAGFYGAFSHDMDEGVARVFDPLKTPGVDVWTYGFQPPSCFPVEGISNCSYAEMWGGNVLTFPKATQPLAPAGVLTWLEYVVPFHSIGGSMTYANQHLVGRAIWTQPGEQGFDKSLGKENIEVWLCPTSQWSAHSTMIELFINREGTKTRVDKRILEEVSNPVNPTSHVFTIDIIESVREIELVISTLGTCSSQGPRNIWQENCEDKYEPLAVWNVSKTVTMVTCTD